MPLAPGARRALLVLALAIAAAAGPRAAGAAACDTDAIEALARPAFPSSQVAGVQARDGVVTLLLSNRERIGTFALALYATGGQLYTSQMTARLSEEDRAAASREIVALFDNAELRGLLLACGAQATFTDAASRDRALSTAIEAALAEQDRGAGRESPGAPEAVLVVGALLLGLAVVAWPWREGASDGLRALRPPALDSALLLAIAAFAVAMALRLAGQMAAEIDEVVTLGARDADVLAAVSWRPGGEPFNPPAAAVLFAVWLRLFDGFMAARLLAIGFIPLTALAAYRAGANLAGRAAGILCAALVVWAPAYLRFAMIARAYSLLALAVCVLLAAIFGTRQRSSRGVGVGLAAVLAVWTSYLLWPLALAAPWLARLARRDRIRVTAAVIVVAAALMPRLFAGVPEARAKTGMFELAGPLDTIGQSLASSAQAVPASVPGPLQWPRFAAMALGALLIGGAATLWWRQRPRALVEQAIILALVFLPLAALLSGGHGIRDRHALPLHLILAWIAAGGLGLLLAEKTAQARALAAAALVALAALAWRSHAAMLDVTADWSPEIARRAKDADVVVIVPEWADGPVHAMLFGNAPEGSDTAKVPPVCPMGTERFCRRVGVVRTVTVDRPTQELIGALATSPRSIWVFDTAHLAMADALQRCDPFVATPIWSAFDCRAGALQPE